MTRQGITRHRRKESQDPGVDGWARQLQDDDHQLSGGCPVPAAALGFPLQSRRPPPASGFRAGPHVDPGTVTRLWLLG